MVVNGMFGTGNNKRQNQQVAVAMGAYDAVYGDHGEIKKTHVAVCDRIDAMLARQLEMRKKQLQAPHSANLGLQGGPAAPFGSNFG